ncbi:carbonate dehydratase [Cupriavidus campinensis]
MTDAIAQLFRNNRDWVDRVNAEDPTFFARLANQQAPEYLWIGCSDSRVPANQILGLAPGEVFVHRNIANVISHSDLNALSVLQFAVEVLKVRHVTVVGHYGCGGVKVALRRERVGLADNWLRHVQDVADKHAAYLGTVLREDDADTRLCELNVIEQVNNVCQTTVLQDAWTRGQAVTVYGWVYGVSDGLLRDLGMAASSNEELQQQLAAAYRQYGDPPQAAIR